MTVDSLVFIKEMLEKEVDVRKRAYKNISELLSKKEDEADVSWNTPDSKVDDNIKSLRRLRETQRDKLSEVTDVLNDFLGKDWN